MNMENKEEQTRKKALSNARYKQKHSVHINIRLYDTTHDDVIRKLKSVPSAKQYIVDLIRQDISR